MSEWQPIETAPRDGSEVLVWCPRCALVPVAMHYTSAEYLQREYGRPDYMTPGWYMSYAYPEGFPEVPWEPTHWMPLPEPPSLSISPSEGAKRGMD